MKKENEDQERPRQENGYYDRKPDFVGKEHSQLRQLWERGKVYFFVIAAGLLIYFILLRLTSLSGILKQIGSILTPIFYGIAIAYLLNPLVRFIEKQLQRLLLYRLKNRRRAERIARSIGILVAFVAAGVIVVGLLNLVIPELYGSIRNVIISIPGELDYWLGRLNEINLDDSTLGIMLKNLLTEGANMLQEWLKTDLPRQANVIMGGLTEGFLVAINTVFNIFIGAMISIYLLFSKERFLAQGKKTLYALLKPEVANKTLHITKKSNEIFSGFITGKIIDSLIIGVICFVVLSLIKMPYAMLVSVIVGVTNIIPFFGPFIGAIPSAILILIEEPRMGIYFIIFIILLQQLDGNVIGPKILGDSTGLPAFWVIFAILLGSGLFGFVGMLMGVPTFSVLYYLFQMIINQKLEKKHLPTHSRNYDEKSYVNMAGEFQPAEESEEKAEDGEK